MNKVFLVFIFVLLISLNIIGINAKPEYTNHRTYDFNGNKICSALVLDYYSDFVNFCKSQNMSLNSYSFKDRCLPYSITCFKSYGNYYTLTEFYLK